MSKRAPYTLFALLVVASLACSLPGITEPSKNDTQLRILSVSVSPSSGSGRFTGTVIYTPGARGNTIGCAYYILDGTKEEFIPHIDVPGDTTLAFKEARTSFDFTATTPGSYRMNCKTSDVPSSEASVDFAVTAAGADQSTTEAPTASAGEPQSLASRAGLYKLKGQFLASKSLEGWKAWLGKTSPEVTGNNVELEIAANGRVTGGEFYLEIKGSTGSASPSAFCATVRMVLLSSGVSGFLAPDATSGEATFTTSETYEMADLHPNDGQACVPPQNPPREYPKFVLYFDASGDVALCASDFDDTSRDGCLAAPLAVLDKTN